MNLRSKLTNITTREQRAQLADYLINKPIELKKMIEVYCAGPNRITQQAADPLERIARTTPSILTPHVGELAKALTKQNAEVCIKRNTLRIFQFVDLPERIKGHVVKLCFRFLQDASEPIAVKVFSMSTIYRQAGSSPELMRELRLILEHQLPYSGPGFRSRARNVLGAISGRKLT